MNVEDELKDPEQQAMAPELVAKVREDALDAEWDRVWDLPIPYYRDKFEAAGLSRKERPPLDLVPRTTKDELRANEQEHGPFGTWRSVGLDDAVALNASGGTTGAPMIHFRGPNDIDRMTNVAARQWWRMGLRPGDRMTHCWPGGLYGPGLRRSLDHLGVVEINMGMPTSIEIAEANLRMWDLLKPNGFLLTGHQLMILEDAAQRIGFDLAAMFDGAYASFVEPSYQYEGPRSRIEALYGMRVQNIGGASDIPGFSIGDCKYHNGFHAPGDGVALNVVDPETGEQVAAGERGHLVVTVFGVDSVWIRFDLEDFVEHIEGPCPCGETGQRFRFIGRGADAAKVAGRVLLPLDVSLALEDRGAPEYQIVRADDDVLHVKIETTGPASDLETELAAALSVPVSVEALEPGSLPRSAWKPRRSS